MSFPRSNVSPVKRPIKGVVRDIGASKTLRIELPTGITLLDLELEAKILGGGAYPGAAPSRAQLIAMWTDIRVLLDGEERIPTIPMTEFVDMVEFERGGIVGATGFLPFLFQMLHNSDPTPGSAGGNDLAAKIAPAWGLKNHSALVIEITQDATSTIDYVDVLANIQPQAEDLGLHRRLVRLTDTFASTGVRDIEIPFKERGGLLRAIHVKPTVLANLTYARLYADGVPWREGTVEMWHRDLLKASDRRTVQTGWLHIDLCWRNFDRDALSWDILDTKLVLQLTFKTAAPNTYPYILDVVSQDTRPPSAAA